MAAKGGPIESYTLAGRIFAVAADQGVETDIGGKSNTIEMNGDGTARLLQARKAWMHSGVKLSIDESRGDLDFLQRQIIDGGSADAEGFVTCEARYTDGSTRSGRGTIVGDLKHNSENATATVDLSGPGTLSRSAG